MSEAIDAILRALKLELLAWAFLGALIALSFWEPANRTRAVINVVTGTVISAASAPAVYAIVLWHWPDFPVVVAVLGALYFWIGLLGMKIVPIISAVIERFRSAKPPGVE